MRARRRARFRQNLVSSGIGAAVLLLVLGYEVLQRGGIAGLAAITGPDRSAERYFSGCREAQQARVTPIYRGQPGYREGMDGDGDGIACESYGPRDMTGF